MSCKFHLDSHADNYAVVGNPVEHSKSPFIHKAFADQTGQLISYQAILVELDGFKACLGEFQKQGGKGLNVTLPFKEDAWQSVDHLSARAERSGSVNTIRFSQEGGSYGDTTDGCGLLRDLANHDISLVNRRVLVLGAGGAVRGVLPDLLMANPGLITIVNRTVTRAEELVGRYAEHSNLDYLPVEKLEGRQFDIIINGTSASLSGQMLELPDNIITGRSVCYDMAYRDTDTVFVRWAKSNSAQLALDGLGMLVEQAAESFYVWRGVRPDTKRVIEMLRSEKSGV